MVTPTPGSFRVLEPHECWALARSAVLGRLAVSVGGRPDVFPVNYAVDRATVVFRTAEGTKLSTVVTNPHVAFEVDGWDAAAGTAWSVVIKGRARRVTRTDDLIDSMSLPLYPWHGGRKECIVRIDPEQVTGRLFDRVDPALWRSALGDAPRTAVD
jgi:hypothetical protein